jgi:lysophospholipase L1-like esterase
MSISLSQRFAIVALCVLGALAHAQLQPAPAPHSAVNPVPREGNWNNRARLLDQRLKDTPDARLLFIGDSITQGWEGPGVTNIWNRYYARRKAVNLGISGDRTQHVLWRLQKAPLDGVKPKVAILMIGTNNSNGEDNTPEQIAQGITAIVRTLRDRLPETKILLLGIFPRGENFNAQRGKLTQINQVIAKLHDGRNVHYLDIGHRFLTDDGLLLSEIMYDYLHLTPKGYEIWAETIEPKLAELMDEGR